MISLGVDASTSVVAWAIVDGYDVSSWRLLDVGHLKCGEMEELERFDAIKQMFGGLRFRNPDVVVLERAVYGYGTNTTSKTLCNLHRLNATVLCVLWQTFILEPHVVAPSTSRKWLNLIKEKDVAVKESVFQAVTKMLEGTYNVTYKKSKKVPTPPKDHHYDEIDAVTLAVHGLSCR